MALFEASRDWPHSVAWIDCLARGAGLGRAVMTRGAFMERGALPPRLASDPLRSAPAGKLRVPADAPSALLNRVSIGLFNALCYRRGAGDERDPGRGRSISTASSFPSTGSRRGTVLYGWRGVRPSTSACCPGARARAGLAALLERVAASGQGSFLAVLKLFGPAGGGADVRSPWRATRWSGTAALLDGLDEITHRHGGRVYLAKDACCAPARMREGYPRLGAFEAVRAEVAGGAAPVRLRSLAEARVVRERGMNKMTTPDAAAPIGRWQALAARFLNPPRGVTLSSRLRNALFVLSIAGILAYGAGFVWYMLAHFDLINLIRDVNVDDSFYYFQIARNLAEGSSRPSTAASRAPTDITRSGCF